MTQSTRERSLTPPEITDRTSVLLSLLDEQDTIRFRVRASRDELREWRVEARNLAARIDQVRSEIRSGVAVEPAQMALPNTEAIPANGHTAQRYGAATLDALTREAQASVALDHDPDCGTRVCEGIDGSSDEPDPETDPPSPKEDPEVNGVGDHELLARLDVLGVPVDLKEIQSWNHRQLYETKCWALYPGAYPRPAHFELLDPVELRHLITCVRPKEAWPTVKEVESWHREVRADVQRWCRVEHARNGHIAGHPMPLNGHMPAVLANLLEHAPKAPRKKATTRKAKP